MGNAADNLIKKYPTRIDQLKGPITVYFQKLTDSLPLNGSEQDLYMTVFYPAARRINPNTSFDSKTRRDNPGIKTPQDYINLVNKQKTSPLLTVFEMTALTDLAKKIGTSTDSLYKLINFESGWNPAARNKISGARGLIQFMPSTARWLGFKDDFPSWLLLALVGGCYFLFNQRG